MMFKAIAAAALTAFVSAGAAKAAPPTSTERQHLVAHLEMTAAWLADELNGLTPAQANYRRQPEAWTITEVLDHLVVVAPIYWQDLQSALKQPRGARRSAMSDADVLWYGIDRTNREQAIAGERPGGQLRDLKAGLETYRKHHDRLLQYIRKTDDELREHIVPRQSCDAYQWALLISSHEQRHILQIREIKADPGFPKK
jgi:4-amino-4-deoxy-L-arabinose transferase-like glycosyltransferase